MGITLISSVVWEPSTGKLGIGAGNDLLVKLKGDMKFFRNITCSSSSTNGGFQNVVVMGRMTWLSIPAERKPLKGRINVVLTRDNTPSCAEARQRKLTNDGVFFTTFEAFCKIYSKNPVLNVFVIGGQEIYSLFMDSQALKPQTIYLTHIKGARRAAQKFISPPDESYKLISVSEKHIEKIENDSGTTVQYEYRFYRYNHISGRQSDEHNYLDMCNNILSNGLVGREDRTKVGTTSAFCQQVRYNISDSIPLFTTKRVAWKHCIEELLWFLRGDTDAKVLQKKGVKIWNGNTSRDFLDGRGLHFYEDGICGPLYGWQWRFCGASYSQSLGDTSKWEGKGIGGVDQIEKLIEGLKNDPFSRRHLVCAWNPVQLDEMVLPPCHFAFQFYASPGRAGCKDLSCHVFMRSNDVFHGHPFNVFSYAVLTYIIGLKTGMKPKELVISITDAHVYNTHKEAIEEQRKRVPRALPKLLINERVKDTPYHELTVEDFDVVGYFPHPAIKADMAV